MKYSVKKIFTKRERAIIKIEQKKRDTERESKGKRYPYYSEECRSSQETITKNKEVSKCKKKMWSQQNSKLEEI